MNRGSFAALTLLLAIPSFAGAQRTDAAAGQKATAAVKQGADASTPKKPTTRRSKRSAEPETSGVSREARSLARRTKSIFIFAVESCTRAGSRCEPTLPNDAEQRFMRACGACNTTVRCEAERDAVLAGTTRASQDPCAP